jgi:hypothetical protein
MGKGLEKFQCQTSKRFLCLSGGFCVFEWNSMSTEGFKRKLSAILNADAAGHGEIAM